MKTNLKWREWRGLHKVYEQGYSTAQIKQNPYVVHLLNRGLLKTSPSNPRRILSTPKFCDYYERMLLEKYEYYNAFLDSLANPNSNYTEKDIGALMIIKSNYKGIIESGKTQRGLSEDLFEDSKYLEKHIGLQKAVLSLLKLESFPGQNPKDHQYIYFTPCELPRVIVLCENLDFLKTPWQAREYNIELWYAGGNNIAKLKYVPELTMPIYYSCDWDYHGLSIYQHVKNYLPNIKLLYPAPGAAKPVNTQNHRSKWRPDIPLSGLDKDIYSQEARTLIESLIKHNRWIEEESSSISELVRVNDICLLTGPQRRGC